MYFGMFIIIIIFFRFFFSSVPNSILLKPNFSALGWRLHSPIHMKFEIQLSISVNLSLFCPSLSVLEIIHSVQKNWNQLKLCVVWFRIIRSRKTKTRKIPNSMLFALDIWSVNHYRLRFMLMIAALFIPHCQLLVGKCRSKRTRKMRNFFVGSVASEWNSLQTDRFVRAAHISIDTYEKCMKYHKQMHPKKQKLSIFDCVHLQSKSKWKNDTNQTKREEINCKSFFGINENDMICVLRVIGIILICSFIAIA